MVKTIIIYYKIGCNIYICDKDIKRLDLICPELGLVETYGCYGHTEFYFKTFHSDCLITQEEFESYLLRIL